MHEASLQCEGYTSVNSMHRTNAQTACTGRVHEASLQCEGYTNLRTDSCFLFHLLQAKVRGVDSDPPDGLPLAQEGAQHSQQVYSPNLVPVKVHNGQSVSLV